MHDNINRMYEFYIPLRGFTDDTANDVYEYFDSHQSMYDAPIKTAHGRKSLADDPLQQLLKLLIILLFLVIKT